MQLGTGLPGVSCETSATPRDRGLILTVIAVVGGDPPPSPLCTWVT